MRTSSLEITMVPVDELAEYAGNAKVHTEAQIEHIMRSIEDYGFNDPVGIWHNAQGVPEIVTGHGAVTAAKRLGITEVPCTYLDHLTDDERRAYCHVHNGTQLETGFDIDILMAEMAAIDVDWSLFGFGGFVQLEESIDDVVESPVPEDAPTICKPGDVWELGDHRLMCGSSTEQSDVGKLVRGGAAQLLITDPPYNVDYRSTDGKAILNDAWDDETSFVAFLRDAFNMALAHMSPGAAFYVFYADALGLAFRKAAMESGMRVRQNLIWVKNTFTLGRQDYQWRHEPCMYGWKDGAHYFFDSRKESTVIEDSRPNLAKMSKAELRQALEAVYSDKESTTVIHEDKPTMSAEHPTMKPVRLIARLVRNSSRPGDTVLDPFGGSGSTLMACEQLGRKCLTMELDPHYCDVIIARWERFTKREARRAG